MNKQPDEMIICALDVLLMPNGEIICKGKRIGFFEKMKEHLTPLTDATGKAVIKSKYD